MFISPYSWLMNKNELRQKCLCMIGHGVGLALRVYWDGSLVRVWPLTVSVQTNRGMSIVGVLKQVGINQCFLAAVKSNLKIFGS